MSQDLSKPPSQIFGKNDSPLLSGLLDGEKEEEGKRKHLEKRGVKIDSSTHF